ncbi:MAG: hypothetical protein A3K10_13360 [Bacteroidetes bacterium RIFCSPLOWO2_12_FULL_31_6]|nr:MAG: hypothetical protein A3K10_13360 [Bacteroidetes bacterium RIFCSPLOWO2_12_FULL_31_6]
MNNQNKIFLLGFMGSGKTTLGEKLANRIHQKFIDLDAEIEKQTKKSIAELFENKGEAYFRKIEKEVLEKFCADKENFVMALGGGTPCFYNNMELINQSGVSIYINYNAGILASRLKNAKIVRPLVEGKSEEELKLYIENTLLERAIFYTQSQFTINKDNIKVEDVLALL